MSKQKKSKLSVKAAEFIPSSKKSTKSAPAQIMMPSQSASSSMIVHPLRYSTYNILSTFRCVEVQESPEMVKKRYTSIIKQIISNNSDFYVLQEIDKTFEINLYKVQNKKKEKLISNQVIFQKSFNNKFIDLSLKDPDVRKLRNYVIEIKPFEKDTIKNVNLIINNQIKLNDYQIIEKKQNCYFLIKND